MRYPDDVPTLTDGAVTLRALSLDDVPRIVEQCNDPASVRWTTVPRPYAARDAEEWVTAFAPANWERDVDLTFAIEYAGTFAGSVALRPRGPGEAEIGFGLHADARGKGVMHAALDLLLDWAFTERGMHVVHWRANVGNWASRRVAWATGFTFGPTIPRLLDHRGELVDAWTAWIGRGDERRPTEPWQEVPVLTTGRLRLRPWEDRDGPALVETAADPTYQHFAPHGPLPTAASAVPAYLLRARLAVAHGDRFTWAVADPDTDVPLGGVAIFDLEGPEGRRSAQVGYWAHPAARGRGVTTEAVRRVAEWAFSADGPGVRRLYLLTAASNTGSRRVAEAAGFTQVGTERSAALVGDEFDDNCVYDLLADDRR